MAPQNRFDDIIFHYTPITNFESIMNSKTLHATHFTLLNDSLEINHGERFLVEALIKFKPDVHPDDVKNLATIKNALGYNLYTSSFCMCNDESCNTNGLLSMWERYSGKNGIAIVFEKKAFDSVIINNSINLKNPAVAIISKAVKYCDDYKSLDIQYQSTCESLAKIVYEDFWRISCREVGCLYNHEQLSEKIIKSLLRILFTLKQTEFKVEHEYRVGLAILNTAKHCANNQGNGPFLQIPFNISNIKKIIIGPSFYQAQNYKHVVDYLNNKGYGIDVTQSKIVYI